MLLFGFGLLALLAVSSAAEPTRTILDLPERAVAHLEPAGRGELSNGERMARYVTNFFNCTKADLQGPHCEST